MWEGLLLGCWKGGAGGGLLEVGWALLDTKDEAFVRRAAGRRRFGTMVAGRVVGASACPAVLGFCALVLALPADALASPASVGIIRSHAEMCVRLGTLVAEVRAAVARAMKAICRFVAACSLFQCFGVFVGGMSFVVG